MILRQHKKENKESRLIEEEKKEKFQQLADKAIDIPKQISRKDIYIRRDFKQLQQYYYVLVKYRELLICWSNLKDKIIIFTFHMTYMGEYIQEWNQKRQIKIQRDEIQIIGQKLGYILNIGKNIYYNRLFIF
ncbi:unnamed protein product [Paramecium sonneborni]|uniref:Uncharacterized protein n=1 Tax=Paramecium sonneborni TaxID=65129 RepID=A0A8S1LPW7_9CILI|nr:unnamed protein product [Paramecium sonneborni]